MEEGERGKPDPTGPVVFDGMLLPPFPPLAQDVQKRINDIKNLGYKKDDVLLAIYPKSGSHWVWETVSMILKRKAEYSKEPKEFLFLEGVPDLDVVRNLPSPRPMNTHLPYRWLPTQHIENGGKIVHVLRNPKDVCVSLFHHAQLGMLPGFDFFGDFKTFFETRFLNPKVPFMDGWFKYEKDFERAQKEDKRGVIFILHYESLKKNPIKETKRLADFLNIELTEEDIAEISDKCSFQNLKQANETVKEHPTSFLGEHAAKLMPKIYRKGEVGDWKNHFTVAMSEQFDAVFKEEMKDSDIQVQFE
ncbi:sulfotransferase 1B1-like [Crassostrea virginica]